MTATAGRLANGTPYTYAQLISLTKVYKLEWNGPSAFVATLSAAIVLSLLVSSITWLVLRWRKAKNERMHAPKREGEAWNTA
jgi:hypothetical protein